MVVVGEVVVEGVLLVVLVQGRVALEQEGEAEVVVGLEELHVGQEWRKLGEVVVVWAGSAGFQNLPSPCHCQD